MRLYAKRRLMSSGVDKDLVAGWKQVTQLNMTARMGQVHHVRMSTLCSVCASISTAFRSAFP